MGLQESSPQRSDYNGQNLLKWVQWPLHRGWTAAEGNGGWVRLPDLSQAFSKGQ